MDGKISCTINRTEQFQEVCSKDFLEFKFGGRGYQVRMTRCKFVVFGPVNK